MNSRMISGTVLLITGVLLFMFGMNAKDSIADRFNNFFTGHFTEYTTWLLVLGMAAGVAGFLALISVVRRPNT